MTILKLLFQFEGKILILLTLRNEILDSIDNIEIEIRFSEKFDIEEYCIDTKIPALPMSGQNFPILINVQDK